MAEWLASSTQDPMVTGSTPRRCTYFCDVAVANCQSKVCRQTIDHSDVALDGGPSKARREPVLDHLLGGAGQPAGSQRPSGYLPVSAQVLGAPWADVPPLDGGCLLSTNGLLMVGRLTVASLPTVRAVPAEGDPRSHGLAALAPSRRRPPSLRKASTARSLRQGPTPVPPRGLDRPLSATGADPRRLVRCWQRSRALCFVGRSSPRFNLRRLRGCSWELGSAGWFGRRGPLSDSQRPSSGSPLRTVCLQPFPAERVSETRDLSTLGFHSRRGHFGQTSPDIAVDFDFK